MQKAWIRAPYQKWPKKMPGARFIRTSPAFVFFLLGNAESWGIFPFMHKNTEAHECIMKAQCILFAHMKYQAERLQTLNAIPGNPFL